MPVVKCRQLVRKCSRCGDETSTGRMNPPWYCDTCRKTTAKERKAKAFAKWYKKQAHKKKPKTKPSRKRNIISVERVRQYDEQHQVKAPISDEELFQRIDAYLILHADDTPRQHLSPIAAMEAFA